MGPARRPPASRRRAASSSRAARVALVALARALAVATLVGLAVADPRASSPSPSASSSSSSSSAVPARPAASSDERVYEVRVDAPTPRAVSGTTRRPGALKLIGHSRLALHRAFHHLVLEVRDDGGFLANNCKLARVTRRSHHPDADADFRSVRVRARKPQPTTDPDPPALVATFGPFDRDVILIPECDRRGAAVSVSSISSVSSSSSAANPVAYRVSLRSSGAADGGRRARLLLGIALVALAPALSEWAAAYYGAGMVLSVTVLALVLIRRAARLAPGGRSARGVASVVAAAAAFAVPSEHLARFLEAYVALCLRPIKLVVRAIVERNADEAGLPVALAATGATLAGAAAGFWAVRRWMIDPDTGGVEPTVAAFARVAMRVVGVVLLLFSTLDVPCGMVLAGGGAAWSAAASFRASRKRAATLRRRLDARRRRRAGSDSEPSGSDEDEDEDEDEGADPKPPSVGRDDMNRRGRGGRRGSATPSSASARRRRRGGGGFGGARGDADDSDDEHEPSRRFAFSPSSPFSPASWFSRAGSLRRRRGFAPETMDPEPSTPPAVLLGTGAGVVGGSAGRTPGAGLRPWRSMGASPFGPGSLFGLVGRAAAASRRDEDDRDDARDDDDAALVGSGSRRSANRARGSSSSPSPSPFAARVPPTRRASLGSSRGRGTAAAAADGRGSRAGGSRSSRFAPTATGAGTGAGAGSPRPPVGAAAASRGRFLTEAEFDAMGREATDRGLDELCGTPEFAKWMRSRAHRVRLAREDFDDDDDDA